MLLCKITMETINAKHKQHKLKYLNHEKHENKIQMYMYQKMKITSYHVMLY